jgi:site-specific recombinase XerD
MKHTRRPPLRHPLAPLFNRAVDSICTALGSSSLSYYQLIVRNFLSYLGAAHRELKSIEQLHREPHLLGWMSHLQSQVPPLATSSYISRLSGLRTLLVELAWAEQLPQLARLILHEDIPRRPHTLPRPLIAHQDQLLQQEFLKRNDLGGNVFLLIRHTGMRIGECADLSFDCLRATGPNQWAILVPLGKLKTERMVPVDSSVVTVIQRLRFYRSLDSKRPDGRLLARRSSRGALIRQLRNYLHRVCHSLGISARIVPHQFRHTYATEMLRAGVSLPSVMKLLGHASLDMTMIHVEVVSDDLQREFQQARSKPRHLVPQPKTSVTPIRTGLDGVIDSLQATQHALEMFRRALPNGAARSCLNRLSNRLIKIITEANKLHTP